MLDRSACNDMASPCDELVLCAFSVGMSVRTPCYRTYKCVAEFLCAFLYNVAEDVTFVYRQRHIPKYKEKEN